MEQAPEVGNNSTLERGMTPLSKPPTTTCPDIGVLRKAIHSKMDYVSHLLFVLAQHGFRDPSKVKQKRKI